ncbi:MAG: Gfo/Idh/MocA family oxidoreductase [Armatimonadetes bacterium]|nr:Gfo/Idh/MocA family oxidoreductase [Armatimonadota bacterium]
MDPLNIGFVGVGNISGIYFDILGNHPSVKVVGCADLDMDRAKDVANKRGIEAMATDALLSSPNIDLVLNLTVPKVHAPINLQALEAGKHVYCEKPLALTSPEARKQVELAQQKGLRLGCAPDTFLGAGIQTARAVLDEGAIGEIIDAHAFMLCRGHESWHPSPEFYYEQGGGPMFDMGPYYVTALVSMLGPVKRIAGSSKISYPTRTITSEPKKGKTIEVETDTHLSGVLDFTSGTTATLTTSFDVIGYNYPPIVILGSEGTLVVPDPNGFGGTVTLIRRSGTEEVPLRFRHDQNSRGLGVIDIAQALAEGRPHRASGELALHVVEVMEAFEKSSREAKHVWTTTQPDRPDAMPTAGL